MPEKDYIEGVRAAWSERCRTLGLRKGTKGRQVQAEAYLQGVLATATAVGAMTFDRAHQIAFLVAVGRCEQFLEGAVS